MHERAIYFEALEITDSDARRRFLDQACGDDSALRQRLDELLKAEGRLSHFLQASPLRTADEDASDDCPPTKDSVDAAATNGDSETEELVVDGYSNTPDLSFLQPPSRPDALGRLAHYDILEILGQGGFGVVFRARDTKLERDVAIKVLLRHLAATSPPRKRFLREARACAAIHHPNVITLFAVEEQPLPYLVMEYVRGSTLQELINEAGPLEWTEILPLVYQLALALDMAHASGLIHRDIKPSNILVEPGPQRRLVITDFGLARTVDDISLTRSGFIAGTPMYMAPEQADGSAVDARADLFSLGSVLYVMVTGRPPFRASSSAAVMRRVITAQPRAVRELIPDAPDWLCALITKLQAKLPQDRFQSARELAGWLEQCQADLKQFGNVQAATLHVLCDAPPEVDRGSDARQSMRGGLLVGGLLVLCTLFVTTALVVRNRISTEPVHNPVAAASTTEFVEDPQPASGPPVLNAPFEAAVAQQSQHDWAEYLGIPVEFTNRWGITFRLIPPGTFLMGSSEAEIADARTVYVDGSLWEKSVLSETPQHTVELSDPFYLATTEVTQRQFEQIMSFDPSRYKSSDEDPKGRRPAESMSWNEADRFVKHLSCRDKLLSIVDVFNENTRSRGYRLPTEAQWEFACRAGTSTPFWSGADERKLMLVENLGEGDFGHPLPVGSRSANPFGLYDMHGNVREYVSDSWSEQYYANGDGRAAKDPQGPLDIGLTYRVHRGGDFWWDPAVARSSSRVADDPGVRPGLTIGIRLAMDVTDFKRLPEKTVAPLVTEYREVHAATLDELRSWIDGLSDRFVPRMINIRSGGSVRRFDAVATTNLGKVPWETLFVAPGQWDQNFQHRRSTHACLWRLTVPRQEDDIEPIEAIAIWLERGENHYGTWTLDLADLRSELKATGENGWIPASVDLVVNAEPARATYCHLFRPGIGHHTQLQRSPAELSRDIEEYRNRDWRPYMIQTHVSDTEPQLSAVFRENVDQVDWEFTDRLTPSQYEAALQRRTAEHWYPEIVYSYVEAEAPLYGVVWQQLAADK